MLGGTDMLGGVRDNFVPGNFKITISDNNDLKLFVTTVDGILTSLINGFFLKH